MMKQWNRGAEMILLARLPQSWLGGSDTGNSAKVPSRGVVEDVCVPV